MYRIYISLGGMSEEEKKKLNERIAREPDVGKKLAILFQAAQEKGEVREDVGSKKRPARRG